MTSKCELIRLETRRDMTRKPLEIRIKIPPPLSKSLREDESKKTLNMNEACLSKLSRFEFQTLAMLHRGHIPWCLVCRPYISLTFGCEYVSCSSLDIPYLSETC